jgi:hypothetical protein
MAGPRTVAETRATDGPRWRDLLRYATPLIVVAAAFPRLARWARWPARSGPRGLIAYIVLKTTLEFALRTWIVPWMRRQGEAHERTRLELATRLGREPTEDELMEHWLVQRRRRIGDDGASAPGAHE